MLGRKGLLLGGFARTLGRIDAKVIANAAAQDEQRHHDCSDY